MAKRDKRRGDGFRRDLAKLVRELVEEGQERDRDSEPIGPRPGRPRPDARLRGARRAPALHA